MMPLWRGLGNSIALKARCWQGRPSTLCRSKHYRAVIFGKRIPTLALTFKSNHLESGAMRRWLLIAVLFLLPYQMVWAAAAPYCAHETTDSVQHFGHHQHKHQGSDLAQPADDDFVSRADHVDCEACHLASPMTAVTPSLQLRLVPEQPPKEYLGPRYVSRVPAGLERPQREHATPAVRFGSGLVFTTFPV